ncbi:SLAM family member 6-like isoform X2 [Xyrauchen texanus]|uniref:SLAM family member 6-like isoform X2 n=1 Tax=Xyrauchen texanus TaxID=154827 RepID=UPI002241A814|nr:SLAM family member 6-like isoform X2 [Xyrauchen texanus]
MKQDYFKMKFWFIVGTLLVVCGAMDAGTSKHGTESVLETDELKSVSVMEGDSVTLPTGVTEIQREDQILWMFGPHKTRIALIYKHDIDMRHSNETFGDKLQLDDQTGSLTIRNIRIKHSGLYKLQIFSNRGNSNKTFNVTVHARLPVPIITRNSSESSSKCVLVCSVVNVTHVTLSWYKGNSSFSNISVSDLNSSLSLDVEYQENNIYSCVVNNPIRNQTKYLNITEVSQMCSGVMYRCHRSSKRQLCDSPLLSLHCLSQSHREKVPELDSLSTTEP